MIIIKKYNITILEGKNHIRNESYSKKEKRLLPVKRRNLKCG